MEEGQTITLSKSEGEVTATLEVTYERHEFFGGEAGFFADITFEGRGDKQTLSLPTTSIEVLKRWLMFTAPYSPPMSAYQQDAVASRLCVFLTIDLKTAHA
jgi:hypothetical protein